MKRLAGFLGSAILGLLLLACAWIVPAHFQAVDTVILQRAGRRTPTLAERGLELVRQNNLGAAELMLQAAREESLPDRGELGLTVTNLANAQPGLRAWGGGERHLEVIFGSSAPTGNSEPFTEWVVRLENRERILGLLTASPRPAVQELLRCRALTNTVVFSPSGSASGQALDAALSVTGMLLAEDKLSSGLSNGVFVLAGAANRGGSP